MTFEEELEAETSRLTERYMIELVERFDLCPWAKPSRRAGGVAISVIFADEITDFDASLANISALGARSEIEVALLVYPLLATDRIGFEDFTRRLRARDAERSKDAAGPFAMAAFHPGATPDLEHAERLVPYIRRTPDPTVQLVRQSVLDGMRGLHGGTSFVDISQLDFSSFEANALAPSAAPPEREGGDAALSGGAARGGPAAPGLRDRIAIANLATVQKVGVEALDAVFSDLLADRERAHSRLSERHGRRGPSRSFPP